ncbi:MAG: vanadium-dependent haloperoxidase [Hyphomicrobiales bacterium]|nr:vanadium-dependent haloperoxidase [Hyphomicrobiales bacterium]
MWNQVALDSTAIDHTARPATPRQRDGFESYQQLGPHRSSRAMAIVHIAMFDAVNTIVRRPAENNLPEVSYYRSYSARLPLTPADASLDIAIVHAAFKTLVYLYPSQRIRLEAIKAEDLKAIASAAGPTAAPSPAAPVSPGTSPGIPPMNKAPMDVAAVLGDAAAQAVLDSRQADGSNHIEPTVGDDGFALETAPGRWQPDPISNIRVALGGRWGKVAPFTFKDQTQFRPPPPPALNDPIYTRDFNEARRLGGDGLNTDRNDSQQFTGVFWAYDGTSYLCAPPRLYNQIVRTIVLEDYAAKWANNGPPLEKQRVILDVARIFALVNTAMADAAISAWEAKWHYRFWRPVTGIRAAATDNNPDTTPEAGWRPVAAPASNAARGPNFTPPFPAYPSGHAVFGGAVFEMLRKFYDEKTPFIFVSDEFNGFNKDAGSEEPRPLLPQSFVTLKQPELDNARSRVYLGVHWQFDADAGISQGNQIASYVFDNAFPCIKRDGANFPCEALSGRAPDTLP